MRNKPEIRIKSIEASDFMKPTVVSRADVIEFQTHFEDLLSKSIDYWRYDEELAEETISKYETTLRRLFKDLPNVQFPMGLRLEDITDLKKIMITRGVGPAGINSAVFALRKFLTYCRDVQKLAVLDPKEIQKAREQKREVIYLTKDEIVAFLKTMNTKTMRGLRMRTLCQLLLSTGMRISEALSLNKKDVDSVRKEAVIIGKGNKQRTVYFTDECLRWLKLYISKRADEHPALFITVGTRNRLQRDDLSKQFRHYAKKAGLTKKVTPHMLRHTFATILVSNNCNLFAIQQMLGHSDIKTTAKYYLGVDKSGIKSAHEKFLKFS